MIDSLTATESSHWFVGASVRQVHHMPWPKFPRHLVGFQSGYEYRHAQRLTMQKYVCYVLRRYPDAQTHRVYAWVLLKATTEAILGRALLLDEKTLMASVGRRVFTELEAQRARANALVACPGCNGSGHVTVQPYPAGEAIPSGFQDVALCGVCDGVGQMTRAELSGTTGDTNES